MIVNTKQRFSQVHLENVHASAHYVLCYPLFTKSWNYYICLPNWYRTLPHCNFVSHAIYLAEWSPSCESYATICRSFPTAFRVSLSHFSLAILREGQRGMWWEEWEWNVMDFYQGNIMFDMQSWPKHTGRVNTKISQIKKGGWEKKREMILNRSIETM